MIDFSFEDAEIPDFDSEFFVLWLSLVVGEEGFKVGYLSYIFCSDEYLLKVNQDYLQHDYYTDIITFDYTEGDLVSGDMFISVDRVKENAINEKVSFLEELKRVCVHGVLHLLGYKDKSEMDVLEMREKEDYYIKKDVPRET